MTRQDARDFINLAAQLKIQPRVSIFSLDHVNEALLSVKDETQDGSAVIVI